MIRLTIDVDAPSEDVIGIKEDFAMYLERFGDSKVVNVQVIEPEQMKMKGNVSDGNTHKE